MKIRVILGLFAILLAGPALAQKVFIDYDKGFDFDSIKTFGWQATSETSVANSNPLLHSRIVNSIEHHLSMGGFTEVDSDPDIYVTYHTSTKEQMSLNTTSFGYGYPGGWAYGGYGRYYGGYGGLGSSTTTVNTYELGTLVIDAWCAATKTLVWRGTAANITITQNPTKMEKRLDKAIRKIVATSKKTMDRD